MRLLSFVLSLVLASSLFAQDKILTMEDAVFGAYSHLAPQKLSQLQWIPESDHFVYVDSLDGQYGLISGNAVSKERSVLLSADSLNAKLSLLGLKPQNKFPGFTWLDKSRFYFWQDENLIVYDTAQQRALLANQIEKNTLNKDIDEHNYHVAFTIENNLYIALRPGLIKQITFDTDSGIRNGDDYVHRQEFGITKGTFWSPKGHFLAFYRTDERMVTEYPLVDISVRPAAVKSTRYPMAGMTSEQVTIGIYDLKTGSTTFLQTGEPKDQYLTNITWSPDEKTIFVAHLNRDQNHMRLIEYDRVTGKAIRTLFEETDPKYVEPEQGTLFVKNDPTRFLWFSNRDGFNHLYYYDKSGKMIRQMTRGNFDVLKLHGFDKDSKTAFITAASPDGMERHFYSVELNSAKMKRLTSEAGTHAVKVNHTGQYFIDQFSNLNIPGITKILNGKGGSVQTLVESDNPLAEYKKTEIKFLKLKNGSGTELNARMIYPADFDSTKKYPVIVYVYGGPHAQMVANRWLGGSNLWFMHLAQKGYIIFTLDNRGSANRGRDFEQAIFRNLGRYEVEDQMVGVDFLKSLSYVDTTRLGVDGWSYGGFMTISMMTRQPGIFKAGVAGGPVIDWQYYEVMYGERYMDTPESNPEGYEEANLLNYVENLDGHLMIIHGTIDPVVVWQNSLQYLKTAVDKGKLADYFVYPGHEHNVRGKDRVHLYKKITSYFDLFLNPEINSLDDSIPMMSTHKEPRKKNIN
ncbi:MAG: DPP IV N-terminal domain-containing protein [Calditrichaceae bacterium]